MPLRLKRNKVAGGNAFEIHPRDKLVHGLAASEVSGQQLGRENDPVLRVWRLVTHPGLADLDGARGQEELPLRKVAVANDVASALGVNTIGVSIEEFLNFGLDGLLDHGFGCVAGEGVKIAGVLKRLIETDGGGRVWIDLWFRCNLAHGVSSCPRWAAEW